MKMRIGIEATRILGSPFIIRLPFFGLFGFNKGALNNGKRALLRNLGKQQGVDRGVAGLGSY